MARHRATEEHFLDLLAGHFGKLKKLEVLIACGTTVESQATFDRLSKRFTLLSKRPDFSVTGLGFTDLVRSRMVEGFLSC